MTSPIFFITILVIVEVVGLTKLALRTGHSGAGKCENSMRVTVPDHLHLMDVLETSNNLTLTRSRGPYVHDLKFMLPIFAQAEIISVLYYFLGGDFATTAAPVSIWPYLIGPVVLCTQFIVSIQRGFQPYCVRLDKASYEVYVNNQRWARFTDISAVTVLTRPGNYFYRWFRLVLDTKDGRTMVLTGSPLITDPKKQYDYRYGLWADKRKYEPNFSDRWPTIPWRPFVEGMQGYDKDDPLVVEIFSLRERVAAVIRTAYSIESGE